MYKKIGKKIDQIGAQGQGFLTIIGTKNKRKFDSLAAGKNFPMFERAKFLAHIFSGQPWKIFINGDSALDEMPAGLYEIFEIDTNDGEHQIFVQILETM